MPIMKTVQMKDHLTGYMLKSSKFKTDLIGIYIKRQLNKEKVGLNTLLSRILVRGTKSYDTTKKLNTYLEACYGMILVSDVVKYGEHHILQIKLQFPDPKHISDKEIFSDALSILKEILFNPLVEEGKFRERYFEQEKKHLIDEIESRVNDKMSYSLERCIECMYEGEHYANYVYGEIEDIKAITNEMLYDHYLKILSSSQVDISVMGDIDFDDVESQLKTMPFDLKSVTSSLKELHKTTGVKTIHENFNVQQGKLVLGYDTPFTFEHDLYEASVLAFHILGGGPNSRLFKVLREEHSLCYYVFTKSDKFKGNMFIGAGIESENYDTVIDLIKEVIVEMDVSKEELEQSKQAMIASIRSIRDFPNSFINFFYTEMLDRPLDYKFDMKAMIEKYQDVTIDQVLSIYKKLSLDTIYFINGGEQ